MGSEARLTRRERFEQQVLPHLNAAHDLARWLLRDAQDAEDVTQEAILRAYQFFDSFRGENAKAWLLTIVRNTGYTWLQKNRGRSQSPFDEEKHSVLDDTTPDADPESLLIASAGREALQRALESLPIEYREAIVLREIEGLSYKEIGTIADIPLGTVMSRLSRGRRLLRQRLAPAESAEEAR